MNLDRVSWNWLKILVTTSCLITTGCSFKPEAGNRVNSQGIPAVDLAIAPLGTLNQPRSYIGTTQPISRVAIRTQTEGRLVNLSVDVGDRVRQGEIIGKLENSLILTSLNRAEAELATIQSEKIRAQLEVNQAQIELQQAQIELQQANSDAEIYNNLAQQGAISRMQAQTAVKNQQLAEKAVIAAQETIKTQEQAVAAIEGRIQAQKATIAQQKQRLDYTNLSVPLAGVVVEKNSESGNLVQAGEEILTVGNFDQVKIVVEISELKLEQIEVGQPVKVKLDAFPRQDFSGTVSRIAPIASANTRKIPVEILVLNPNGRISGGLLARIQFESEQEKPKVIVPTSAIARQENDEVVYVVLDQEKNRATVTSRKVRVGPRNKNKAVILSGISVGETYVVRSSKPLDDGDLVGISILAQPNTLNLEN